jgi:hypothetical protein
MTANSGSGQTFGMWGDGHDIVVPNGYVSGAALSGSSTFTGKTIAGLGLTPGTYVYTWGTGGNADSLRIQIGAAPEPSTLVLAAVGGTAMAGSLWLRRRRAARALPKRAASARTTADEG